MKKGLGASDMEVVTLGAKHNGMHSESIYWCYCEQSSGNIVYCLWCGYISERVRSAYYSQRVAGFEVKQWSYGNHPEF